MLVGVGIKEVAEDFVDLVVLDEEAVVAVLAVNRSNLASTRMSFTVGPLGSEKASECVRGALYDFFINDGGIVL